MSETTSRMANEEIRNLRKWCLERAQLESHQHVLDLIRQAAEMEIYVKEGENPMDTFQLVLDDTLHVTEMELTHICDTEDTKKIVKAVFNDLRNALKKKNLINPNNT